MKPAQLPAAVLAALAIFAATPSPSHANAIVQITDVGQGDGIIVYCPQSVPGDASLTARDKIVIDFGSDAYPNDVPARDVDGRIIPNPVPGQKPADTVRDNLVRALGGVPGPPAIRVVPNIRHLVITHGDKDHHGIIRTAIDDGRVTVSNVFLGGYPSLPLVPDGGDYTMGPGNYLMTTMRRLLQNGIPVRWAHARALWRNGRVEWDEAHGLEHAGRFYYEPGWNGVVSCPASLTGDSLSFRVIAANAVGTKTGSKAINRHSAVILARYQSPSGTQDFWFTGDATNETEREIWSSYEYTAGADPVWNIERPDKVYLKIGHHGATESSAPRWLRFLKPNGAFVSALSDYGHGHPHRTAINRFKVRGSTLEFPFQSIPCASPRATVSSRKRKTTEDTPKKGTCTTRVVSTEQYDGGGGDVRVEFVP